MSLLSWAYGQKMVPYRVRALERSREWIFYVLIPIPVPLWIQAVDFCFTSRQEDRPAINPRAEVLLAMEIPQVVSC